MAAKYSVSRIGAFDQCRLQYKYRYLDRLPSDSETIEAFMGSRVHEALKDLYDRVKNRRVESKDWLLGRYNEHWDKNFGVTVKVVKKELAAEDYRAKGRACLSDYYDAHVPFDRAKVVSTEEMISFSLKDGDEEFQFGGVLDRLDWNDRDGLFEIHDYKTSGSLLTQEAADADIQLPVYQIAIASRWPEARRRARLVWHYLLFNKEVESSRTEEQLESLGRELVRKIGEIEACAEFSPNRSALCDWCGYQSLCPEWKHPLAVEALPPNAYLQDPGVVLVAKYAELEARKKDRRDEIAAIEAEQDRIKGAALAFGARERVNVIDGPGYRLQLVVKDELAAPFKSEDEVRWRGLRDFLIVENRFSDVSTVNNMMLASRMRDWPRELVERMKPFLVRRQIRDVLLKKKG
jgi:putative RecB family exonuclease